jgi:hypothetical protein
MGKAISSPETIPGLCEDSGTNRLPPEESSCAAYPDLRRYDCHVLRQCAAECEWAVEK